MPQGLKPSDFWDVCETQGDLRLKPQATSLGVPALGYLEAKAEAEAKAKTGILRCAQNDTVEVVLARRGVD
jgi:hypothetical protein